MLAAAVQRAGLGDQLKQGKLTIFAPSDDAFRAAGYANVAAVNAAPAADLQRLLQYHVIASTVDASAFPTGVNTTYATLLPNTQPRQGSSLSIKQRLSRLIFLLRTGLFTSLTRCSLHLQSV
ncbi:fasciclin domain-containing protein [Spirosoma soli]|uniref:Fasciclin domain-containing protein n=1 Tax=Spirosoma soli TaxID=1770529 RepID=A0ABW5M1B8_9BACT